MNTELKTCLACNEGTLEEKSKKEISEYKGKRYSVDIEYSECPICGSEFVLPNQIKRNRVLIKDEHRKIEGLLTGSEIKAIREKLGLSRKQASEMFTGSPNSFFKYECGEVIQSVAVDKLIRLAAQLPSVFDALNENTLCDQSGAIQILPRIACSGYFVVSVSSSYSDEIVSIETTYNQNIEDRITKMEIHANNENDAVH